MTEAASHRQIVHYDEFEDVVLALELVARLAKDVYDCPRLWKWIITAMQNAVQGAMVLALAATDSSGALTVKSQLERREWLKSGSNPRPHIMMAEYVELLARVQKAELMHGLPLVLSQRERRQLEQLNELRRYFAHFNPTGWSIQPSYLLGIMPVAMNTVELLFSEQERQGLHLDGQQKLRVADALATTRNSLFAAGRSR